MSPSDTVQLWSLKVLGASCVILFLSVIKLNWDQNRLREQISNLQISIHNRSQHLYPYEEKNLNYKDHSTPTYIRNNNYMPFPTLVREKRDVTTDASSGGKIRSTINAAAAATRRRTADKRRIRCRQKNNSRRCIRRSRPASEVISMLFKGGRPETFTKDGGIIAPWFLDNQASSPKLANKSDSFFRLVHGMGAVEIQRSGMYFIYAQVYYLTSERLNSFAIKVAHPSSSTIELPLESIGEEVSLCSSNASNDSVASVSGVSCYTSLVRFLVSGDRVFLQQKETKRRVIFREGHSYLGLVSLEYYE